MRHNTNSTAGSGMNSHTSPTPHSLLDDLQALLVGTLFIALGLFFIKHIGLMAGGTVGLALLANYAFGLPFAPLLIAINTPFYFMAWWRMGWRFTLKTVVAVLLLTLYTHWLPRWIGLAQLEPISGAVIGGLLLGAGFLILFRHRASLGGFNVLVLWLQERYGWSAGWVQLALDTTILLCALPWLSPTQMLLSIVTAIAMNLSLALNHKPGRYVGV